MVIGGATPGGERLAETDFTILELKFRVSNEVWDFRTITSRTINSFENKEYNNPVLFLVDPKFCVQEIYPTPVSFPTATTATSATTATTATFTTNYVPATSPPNRFWPTTINPNVGSNYPTASYQSSP